jgi:hypothetical protein
MAGTSPAMTMELLIWLFEIRICDREFPPVAAAGPGSGFAPEAQ